MRDGLNPQAQLPDAVGLLAQITGAISNHGGNLLEVSQYTDVNTGWFFARLAIEKGREHWEPDIFANAFAPVASRLRAVWSIRPAEWKTRTVILIGKQEHCLVDLLWRWRSGELGIEVPLVISNHETCRLLVEREKIPFEFVAFEEGKAAAFQAVSKLLRDARTELIVLARFMQILPGWLCNEYAGRLINIHHSFLPAFVGANPYQRAFERGVKLIGATCHYATENWMPARSLNRRSHGSNITTTPRISFASDATASALLSLGAFATTSKTACSSMAQRPSCSGIDLDYAMQDLEFLGLPHREPFVFVDEGVTA